MAYQFPNSPTIGDMANGYAYDGEKWISTSGTAPENLDTRYVNVTGDAMSGNLTPSITGTINLGSATLRWGTVYTSDLDLNNGVGDWTIVEGESDLFVYNNKRGRVYKFMLTEVAPTLAPRKKV